MGTAARVFVGDGFAAVGTAARVFVGDGFAAVGTAARVLVGDGFLQIHAQERDAGSQGGSISSFLRNVHAALHSQARVLTVFVLLANAGTLSLPHVARASLLTAAVSWAPAELCSSGHLTLFRLSPRHVISEGP